MRVFESTAGTYEDARRRLIPCFDEFYGTAVRLLPETTGHVLDLGAGRVCGSGFRMLTCI